MGLKARPITEARKRKLRAAYTDDRIPAWSDMGDASFVREMIASTLRGEFDSVIFTAGVARWT